MAKVNRVIPKKSAVTHLHRYARSSNSEVIYVESHLEFLACFWFDFSPNVIDFRSQPFTLWNPSRKGWIKYTPDFEVTFKNGKVVNFEVKSSSEYQKLDVRQKLDDVRIKLLERGKILEVITDDDLKRGTMERNLKLLHRYTDNYPLDLTQNEILRVLKRGPTTLAKLASSLLITEQVLLAKVLNLVGKKKVSLKLYEAINDTTVVKILEDENRGENKLSNLEQLFNIPLNVKSYRPPELFTKCAETK